MPSHSGPAELTATDPEGSSAAESSAAIASGDAADLPSPKRASIFETIGRFALGLLFGLGVAALACYLMGIDLRDTAKNLAGLSPWCVIGCVAASFVVLAFQSLRWHSVMSPLLHISYKRAYCAQVVGFMFNAVIPARGGDLLRVQYLGRATGKSRAAILGTEIVDRWLDWWGWIPAFLVFCIVSKPPSWLFKALGVFLSLLVCWAGAMIWLIKTNYKPKQGSRWATIFHSLTDGVAAFRSPKIWLIAFLVSPLPWVWESLVISQAANAFGFHLDLLMAFSVLIGFNLATVVPSPGGIGTAEAGGTAALMFFGVDKSTALAFMCVYHLSQLIPGIITGGLVLMYERRSFFRYKAPSAQA